MTWQEEIRRKDPGLAKDYAIVGWGQSVSSLRNMVRALKMMRRMNTAEDEARLAAAQRILRKSSRKNPRKYGITRKLARAALRARHHSKRLKSKLRRRLGYGIRSAKHKIGFVRRAALGVKRHKKARR